MAIGSDQLFTTDFTGADGALAADWSDKKLTASASGSADITRVSNRAEQTTAAGVDEFVMRCLAASITEGSPDYKIDFICDGGGADHGVALRMSGDGATLNGYLVVRDGSGNWGIRKITNGVRTSLGSGFAGTSWLNGTLTAEAETVGDDVVLRFKSTTDGTVQTVTDINPDAVFKNAGQAGVAFGDGSTANGWVDDFTVVGTAPALGLSISGINSGNPVRSDAATWTIQFSGDGPITGVTVNGVAQTIDSQDASSVTVQQYGGQYGDLTVEITDGTDTASVTHSFLPPTTADYVVVGTPAAEVDRLQFTDGAGDPIDPVTGDQVEFGNVQGGTIADVTVNTDLTYSTAPAVSAFDYRLWDQATGAWGTWATVTIDITAPVLQSITVLADGIRADIVFDEVVEVGPGGGGGFTASMTDGAVTFTYASGGGTNTLQFNLDRTILQPETGTADYTQPGDGLQDLAGNDLPNISGAGITNNSTQGVDSTPDAPALGADVTGAEPETEVTRNITVSGMDAGQSATYSATGAAEVSLNGGAPAAFVVAENGDTVTVHVTASSSFSTAVTGGVSCTGGSDSITVTTRAADNAPIFTIQAETDVALNTLIESQAFVPADYELDYPLTASISAGGEYQVSLDGGATWGAWTSADTQIEYVSGQLAPRIKVRQTSANAYSTLASVNFTFGATTAAFDVTTRAAPDLTPDAINLGADVVDANPGQTVTRSFQLTGIEAGFDITVSATGDASTQVSVNGGAYAASVQAQLNDTISVRGTAGAYDAILTMGVDANGVTDSVTLTTIAAPDVTPDVPNLGADIVDAEPGAAQYRDITVAGMDPGETATYTATGDATIALNPDSGGTYGLSVDAQNGDVIRVRIVASNTFLATVSGGISCVSGSDSLDVTTRAADVVPTAPNLGADVVDADPADVIIRSFQVAGVDAGQDITWTATGSAQVATGAGAYGPSTVAQLGQTVNVRLIAGDYTQIVSGGVSAAAGAVSDSFSVTTRATDVTPAQFDLGSNIIDMEPDQTVVRMFQVAGIDAGETITFSATGDAEVRISGGVWGLSADAQLDDVIEVRLTSGTWGATVTGGASANGVSDSFSLTTRVNLAPVITGPAAPTVDENVSFARSYTITDLDGQTPTLSGTDAALFNLTDQGGGSWRLSMPAQDFEAPADANGDNVYEVTITADDAINPPVTLNVAVTVVDVVSAVKPDPFDLGGPVTGADPGTTHKAKAFVVSGAPDGASMEIVPSNGEYAINSGARTTTPGFVENGDLVEFWVTASDDPMTAVTGNLNIAGRESDFIVLTGEDPAVDQGIVFYVRDRSTGDLIIDTDVDVEVLTEQFGGTVLFPRSTLNTGNEGKVTVALKGGSVGQQVFVMGILPTGRIIAGHAGILDLANV